MPDNKDKDPSKEKSSKPQFKTGLIKYDKNPSIEELNLTVKKKKVFAKSNRTLIITDIKTGEQLPAQSGATFIEEIDVDNEMFVKLYAIGVKQIAKLSTAGYKLFELVYHLMLGNTDTDRIMIEYHDLKASGRYTQSQKTFIAGVNNLLENEIIYQTTSPYMYFINMKLLFNGDRINVVRSYRLKKDSKPAKATNKAQLSFFDDTTEEEKKE